MRRASSSVSTFAMWRHSCGAMADDPQECLCRAIECERLSQTLADNAARQVFAAIAKTWRELASELRKENLKNAKR
jgi:hypothetical protein